MWNHRNRRVLTRDAAHTNCLLQLIGKEWLLRFVEAGKGLDKAIICRLCYLAIDKVVALHKKLEVVKQGIKEAEHGVILKFNQNIYVAATTVDVCMPVSTIGLEARVHCDRIVKEASSTSPGVTVMSPLSVLSSRNA